MAKFIRSHSTFLWEPIFVLRRSFSISQAISIRSGGYGESVTPRVTHRERGRFGWSSRARWFAPALRDINKRRENAITDQILRYGTENIPRRSEFTDWNYNAELYAFQSRIGEKFDEEKLIEAFVTPGYLEAEQVTKKNLGLGLPAHTTSSLRSNKHLSIKGKEIVQSVLKSYINVALPDLPDDGVEAFINFLISETMLAHVSFLIGTKDLLLCEEYPPSESNMAQTFLALVAALEESSGAVRATSFVLDILATQLNGKDISEIWDIPHTMNYLSKELQKRNMGEPESRLLWCSGKETIFSCYHVGIFSNKELIGQAAGETSEIAEEMAALDALRRLYKFEDSSKPLPFGRQLQDVIPKMIKDKIDLQTITQ